MLALSDLSNAELTALYSRTADFVEMAKKFVPTTSITGLIHHGENFMDAIETRITANESRRARKSATSSQSAEVK